MVQFLHHLEILEQLIVPTKRQNYRQRGDSRDITDGQAKASNQANDLRRSDKMDSLQNFLVQNAFIWMIFIYVQKLSYLSLCYKFWQSKP